MEDQREERPRRDRLSAKTLFPQVLVVDDEPGVATDIVEALRRNCLNGTPLESPIGVAEQLLERRANVLVVSRHMAALDAERLVPLLREDARLNGLIVVVTVGDDTADLFQLAETCQANAAVRKGPELGKELTEIVLRAFEVRNVESE